MGQAGGVQVVDYSQALLLSGFTFIVTVMVAVFGSKMMRLVPILIGVAAGYTAAALITSKTAKSKSIAPSSRRAAAPPGGHFVCVRPDIDLAARQTPHSCRRHPITRRVDSRDAGEGGGRWRRPRGERQASGR